MTTTAVVPTPHSHSPSDPPRRGSGGNPMFPLNWLRGIAALSVVFFHAYQHNRTGAEGSWPWDGVAHQAMLGTDLFVDMFFVLSGFVLWLPVARACVDGRTGRPGWVMLFRRMARLLPLYYSVVIVVWAVTNPSLPGHWVDLLSHLTFTHIYSDEYIFWTNGPAWSLGVEFHFYVLMAMSVPFVHAGVRRVESRRGRLAVALALPALATVVGIAYLVWLTTIAHPSPTNWSLLFSPLARSADFGLGMGLAVLSASGFRLGRTARITTGVVGTLGLMALVMQRPDTIAGLWWHPAYALAIAVALSGIVLHDGPWPAVFGWRPLAWLGGLGYGIYLIHEPVMRYLGHLGALPEARTGSFFVITALLVAVPTVALAWVSSRTVEAGGLKMLAVIERDGRPRDYYAHVKDEDRSGLERQG